MIAHCIYGADINPMAIELAKVALWLESQDAGKPLAFLDHRLRVGNSLLGTTPELMNAEDAIPEKTVRGVTSRAVKAHTLHLPDDAFSAIEGDDKKVVSELKKRNKQEREHLIRAAHGAQTLFSATDDLAPISAIYRALDKIEPERLENVQAQESTFAAIRDNQALKRQKLLADAWCAAFVAPKVPDVSGITTATLNALKQNPDAPALADVRVMAQGVAEQYMFLHPHIEFPDVFTPEQGGFDCVLGNPPWERIKLQEKEWFAQRVPEVAEAPNAAARTRMIAALKTSEHTEQRKIHAEFGEALRQAEGESHFIRASNRYPLTGRGDVNTYAIFSEVSRDNLNLHGRMGIIVPTGIATDDTTKFFFQSLILGKSLVNLYDFENKFKIFLDVAISRKFCLMTVSGSLVKNFSFEFAFNLLSIEDLNKLDIRYTLSPDEIMLINPNTGTAPMLSNKADAEIIKSIYGRLPVLVNENNSANPWDVSFIRMFDSATNSDLFKNMEYLIDRGWQLHNGIFKNGDKTMLPLYEPKFFHQYDHRFGTYLGIPRDKLFIAKAPTNSIDRANSPDETPLARYWVSLEDVVRRVSSANYFIAFRKIVTVSTNRRISIFSAIPFFATNDAMPIVKFKGDISAFMSMLNSFSFEYVLRKKISGNNLNFFVIKQIPILPPSAFTTPRLQFVTPRVLELTYTAFDLTGFAHDLDYPGDPFTWNDERRFWLRAELDALYFIKSFQVGCRDVLNSDRVGSHW